jgi:uncharacterized protein (DUF1499 family)
MITLIKRMMLLGLLSQLTACIIFPLKQTDQDRSLRWCPPLPNCASTEAVTFVHSIEPFELIIPVDKAWPLIRETVSQLVGTTIEHEYPGYLYAKTHSPVFHFLDYFEVLVVPESNRLNVRSSSLLGISDLSANYLRTENFRASLEIKGVIGQAR